MGVKRPDRQTNKQTIYVSYSQHADTDVFVGRVEDDLYDRHDNQLEGADLPQNCPEADEDSRSGEVTSNQTAKRCVGLEQCACNTMCIGGFAK